MSPCPCEYTVRDNIPSISEQFVKSLLVTPNHLCKYLDAIVKIRNLVCHDTKLAGGSDIKDDDYDKHYKILKEAVGKIENITKMQLWSEDGLEVINMERKALDKKNGFVKTKPLDMKTMQLVLKLEKLLNRKQQKTTHLKNKTDCNNPQEYKQAISQIYKGQETDSSEVRLKEYCEEYNL